MEKVELIARGYEWVCPKCGHLNTPYEVTETVTCNNATCRSTFEVEDYYHAIGG